MVHTCPKVSGLEKVDRVQVGDVDASGVGSRTLWAVFLDVHSEEAYVDAIDLFEGEQGTSAVGEVVVHFLLIHIPIQKIKNWLQKLKNWNFSKIENWTKSKEKVPSFHSAFDLDSLVSSIDNPDVDLSRIGFLFPQEIIDPRLNPGA